MGLRRLAHAALAASYPALVAAAPMLEVFVKEEEPEVKPGSAEFWIQGATIIVLVLCVAPSFLPLLAR
jgi:hypothetical protein